MLPLFILPIHLPVNRYRFRKLAIIPQRLYKAAWRLQPTLFLKFILGMAVQALIAFSVTNSEPNSLQDRQKSPNEIFVLPPHGCWTARSDWNLKYCTLCHYASLFTLEISLGGARYNDWGKYFTLVTKDVAFKSVITPSWSQKDMKRISKLIGFKTVVLRVFIGIFMKST